MASDDTYDDEEGVSMVLVKDGKKAATKSVTKSTSTSTSTKAAARIKGATKARPQPKSVLRTTASKRAAAETNGGGPCLCGCPSTAVKWFRRGHIKRFDSQLAAIKAGTIKPTTAFGKDIAKAMGPWKENRGGGFVPATTNFDKIRANL